MEFISGLLIGAPVGFLLMGLFSARAYNKGKKDATPLPDSVVYNDGFQAGYVAAYDDMEFAQSLAEKRADEVVFSSNDKEAQQ